MNQFFRDVFISLNSGKSVIVVCDMDDNNVNKAAQKFFSWVDSNIRVVLSPLECKLKNGTYIIFRKMVSRLPNKVEDSTYLIKLWPPSLDI